MPTLKRKTPCYDCPFRRDAAPGWLGDADADSFVRAALGDYVDWPLPCHLDIDYLDGDWRKTQYPQAGLCAGALIFCRNNVKNPRDPQRSGWVQKVRQDPRVFEYPWEFYEFHGAELPEDIAFMKRCYEEGP